jgi:ribonuclease E
MKKEMLINCLQSEEIRIAIIENGVLEELYVERASAESYVGNIYKGRVVNIEPSIQAAFVDFGVGRNGFLHVSDVEPAYYKELEESPRRRGGDRERGGRGGRGGRSRDQQLDDYDAPRRTYPQPPPRTEFEGEAAESTEQAPQSSFFEPTSDAGQDIITEEIFEDDDGYSDVPVREPVEAEADPDSDWQPPTEQKIVYDVEEPDAEEPNGTMLDEPYAPAPMDDEPAPMAELTILDEETGMVPEPPVVSDPVENGVADAEPAVSEDEESEEEKPKRKGTRKPRAKAPAKPKKPRKRAAEEEETPAAESVAEPEKPAEDEPRPRPMDSSEHRTEADEPSHGPIEPRPASSADLTDDDLSFSKAPPPSVSPSTSWQAPHREAVPVEEAVDDIIVQEEEFDEFEEVSEVEDNGSAPLAPAIPKVDPVESLEDLVEEEKALEDEEQGELEDEVIISQIGGEDAPFEEREETFDEVDAYQPRSRGGDRGGRGGSRGGRGGDRGGDRGRGRGGPRSGDRGGPRGGRDAGRRPSGGGRPGFGRPKPNIEEIFKRGQEVLVQVIKEGIGTKGPTLSTYISIAGRYLVLMPGLNRIGVSRKIEDEETRRRLREIMNELKPPRGLGFIIRTAGQDRDRQELQSDLAYLSRLWQVVARRIKKQKSPSEIYRESDMVTRTIRDIFTADIDTIWVDERGAYEAAKEFMEAVMPRYADRIKFYDGTVPMFHKYGIEAEMSRIQERKISLPYGGSIVIDQTEALVAIDVNSGNFRADNNNAEETAYQMNLQAAKEIARQLRLRDLGGVIANDFIDMREERHRRGVEKALRDAVQRDRARTKILRISQFGIIEMTRQRIRPSLKRSAFQDCTHCRGTGHVKTCESVSIDVMRMLQLAVNREHIQRIDIRVHEESAKYLLNKKRKDIVLLEEQGNKPISITSAGAAVSPEFLEFQCYDSNGNEVKFTLVEEAPPRPPRRRGH